jgi:hypothetical protein
MFSAFGFARPGDIFNMLSICKLVYIGAKYIFNAERMTEPAFRSESFLMIEMLADF